MCHLLNFTKKEKYINDKAKKVCAWGYMLKKIGKVGR